MAGRACMRDTSTSPLVMSWAWAVVSQSSSISGAAIWVLSIGQLMTLSITNHWSLGLSQQHFVTYNPHQLSDDSWVIILWLKEEYQCLDSCSWRVTRSEKVVMEEIELPLQFPINSNFTDGNRPDVLSKSKWYVSQSSLLCWRNSPQGSGSVVVNFARRKVLVDRLWMITNAMKQRKMHKMLHGMECLD